MDKFDGPGPQYARMAWLLAASLFAATLAWPVPMMLWDHLDLVPVYEAWQQEALLGSGVADVHHGSHVHLTAYLLLLGTTWLSDGRTWVDCLLNWALLAVYAALMLRTMTRALPAAPPRWLLPALVGFVLYPGHLANLQWGWQVAVFVCLAGVAAVLAALARPAPGWRANIVALAAAGLAATSFSTGLAVVPVAVVLIALDGRIDRGRRLALIVPWVALAGAVVVMAADAEVGIPGVRPMEAALYVLNYLGGGIARFATDLAPWLALAALASAVACAWVTRRDPRTRFWAALLCFAVGAAALTAAGRVSAFGPEHALVSRYVSFSSTFWVGWLGLVALALPKLPRPGRRILGLGVGLVLVFGALNALHMVKKARDVAERSERTALAIRAQYPEVDEAILQEIYFGRSEEARQRLEVLHRRQFAPFRPE